MGANSVVLFKTRQSVKTTFDHCCFERKYSLSITSRLFWQHLLFSVCSLKAYQMPVNIAKAMVQLSTYPAPVQGIQHFEENVEMTVEDSGLGAGSLYVTESNVLW